MVSDAQVRCVALFFLYAFLDETLSLSAADRTVALLKTKLKGHAEESGQAKQILISTCYAQYKRYKKIAAREAPQPALSAVLRGDGPSLKVWAQFHKEAGEDELLSVILGRILGFSTSDIAPALNISEGTAHYRLGRGVRKLGEMSRSLSPQAEA